MTAMRAAHCGDFVRMPGCGEPVMDRGPDAAALNRRIAGSMMTGDQQDYPLATSDRLLQRTVDRSPGPIEVHAVEIEHPIGLNRAAAQLLIPASVKRLLRDRHSLCRSGFGRWQGTLRRLQRVLDLTRLLNGFRFGSIAGERADRCSDPSPKLALLRAERAHGRRCPWAPGSVLYRSPTCRRRLRPPRSPRPNRYRSGSAP